MIPLLMQEGFRAKGWLGLILGTRIYLKFYPSAVKTPPDFMQQMDALIREVGDRGKTQTKVSEGVPPRAPAPAPAAFEPTPAPAPARTPSHTHVAPISTPDHFSPSMQLSSSMPMVQHQQQNSLESPALVERLLNEAKADRAEFKVELHQQRSDMEQQRKEMEAKMEQQQAALKAELTAAPPAAITEGQLVSLQARVEGLHATKLLTDEELFSFEDLIADWVSSQPCHSDSQDAL